MEKKIVSGTMLTLLLMGMLILASDIQPVKASGTIIIRADGSVDPDTAPISSVDNVTYIFTDNIYDGIWVQRSNIIIDGDGYTLQGSGSGGGFGLIKTSNVTIKRTKITGSEIGIYLGYNSHNTISGNDITNNEFGIWLEHTSYNTISGNNITNNEFGIVFEFFEAAWNNTISGNSITCNNYGILLTRLSPFNSIIGNSITCNNHGIVLTAYVGYNTISGNNITNNEVGIQLGFWAYDNTIYHNNFVDNTEQVDSEYYEPGNYPPNVWDDGYPSGGNYWSDYAGVDLYSGPNQNQLGSDGIGDTEYVVYPTNHDKYPLMYLWGVHDIAITSVTVSATEVFQGDLVIITVTVRNEAGPTETFNVTLYANSTVIGEETVTDLAPTAETTLTFSWNTTEVDIGSYITKAEAGIVAGETDIADNFYVDGTVEVVPKCLPVAVIVAPTEACVSEVIAFSGAGSYDPDGGLIVGCLWDFGDGAFSTELNPTHSYALAGTYEVTLVVTDDEGQVSDPVPHVIEIKSLGEALQELIETIVSWNLGKGIENSLTSKLEEAIHLLNKGNDNGAIHKLMDFINQVEALREMKLTIEQADYLTAEAQRIIDLIKG